LESAELDRATQAEAVRRGLAPAQEEAEAEGEQESEQGDAGELDDEDESTDEVDMAERHELAIDAMDDGDIEGAKRILKGRGYAVSST
jgi:hypothetical protein